MSGGGNQDRIGRERDCHVIGMASKWSSFMEIRLKQQPVLLKPSAGDPSCCIFRAPHSLVQINEKAYEPQIVSIGPYHHGQKRLDMVEQHKPRFFSALLQRTKDGGMGLDDYFNAVASKEKKIRGCYSEILHCETSTLVEMMVLDACFIVEVFRIFGSVVKPDPEDPFFTMPWIHTFLMTDLLQSENQIPFFVLQEVFNLSEGDTVDEAGTSSLCELALSFFNRAAQRPDEQLKKFYGVSDVKHLLDLIRLSFIGHSEPEQPGYVYQDDSSQLLPSATQLRLSGIKFKPMKDDNSNLLAIQFDDGELRIPPLTLDDFMSSFLLNCLAFEQCYCSRSRHITTYISFMRCLVSTERDAALLSENQVLGNYLGSHAEVTTFFNDLGKVIAFDPSKSYLAELFGQVKRFHPGRLQQLRSEIERKYFSSPWSRILTVVGVVLSVLTVLASFYTVYAYYRPPK